MNKFEECLKFVLGHEGGESNHEIDSGGHTNYGISLRFLKNVDLMDGDINGDGHISSEDIKLLTASDVSGLYHRYFYEYYRINEINNVEIAKRALSFFVNMRGTMAAKIMQCSVNFLHCINSNTIEAVLDVDGVMGSKTIEHLNGIDNVYGELCVINEIRFQAARNYRDIVFANPGQEVFLDGWMSRARS